MSFLDFFNNIPAAANSPSVDQPNMLTNNASNASIWTIDHIGFNNSQGGYHQQVTFNATHSQGAQTDPQSVLFTQAGSASTKADMYFKNQNGTFQVSPIRAWGTFDKNGATLGSQLENATVSKVSMGVFTVTMSANAVTGNNFAVLVSTSQTTAGGSAVAYYNITGAAQFQINIHGLGDTPKDVNAISFAVLQL